MKIGAGKVLGAALFAAGVAAIALVAVAVAGCGRDPQQDVDPRIADATRPVVMLTHATEPPHSYVNEAGEYAGMDVDLARKVAEKMGRPLVVEGVEFSDIIPRLKAGTADFAISTITITEARRRDVDFSIPYAQDGSCFLYRTDGVRPRMSHISALRIAVETDSVQDIYLCWHGCDPVRFVLLSDAVSALERDEVDAVFFDAPPLRSLAEQSGGRFAVTPLMTRDRYGIAVDKRRPDVLEAANAVIAEGGAK
jgi:polar amino acid transport system substrate-binding protein